MASEERPMAAHPSVFFFFDGDSVRKGHPPHLPLFKEGIARCFFFFPSDQGFFPFSFNATKGSLVLIQHGLYYVACKFDI
jgi:hypothetical protein